MRQTIDDRESERGCLDPEAEVVDDRFCCVEKVTLEEQQIGGSGGYKWWKIQNSWGTGWGDQGFMYLEDTNNGAGTCGLYSVPVAPYV